LLQAGANPNFCTSLGKSCLYRSCLNNHLEVAKLLLEYGADSSSLIFGKVSALSQLSPLDQQKWNDMLDTF
jgi:ankyrin repeat protein